MLELQGHVSSTENNYSSVASVSFPLLYSTNAQQQVASRRFTYWDSEVKSLQTTLTIRWSPMTPSDPCCNITCVVQGLFLLCLYHHGFPFLGFSKWNNLNKSHNKSKIWTCVVLPTIIFSRSTLWTEYFHPSTQPWSSSGLHFCSSPAVIEQNMRSTLDGWPVHHRADMDREPHTLTITYGQFRVAT